MIVKLVVDVSDWGMLFWNLFFEKLSIVSLFMLVKILGIGFCNMLWCRKRVLRLFRSFRKGGKLLIKLQNERLSICKFGIYCNYDGIGFVVKFMVLKIRILRFVKFLNYDGIGVGVKLVMFKWSFFKFCKLFRLGGSFLEKFVVQRFKFFRVVRLFNVDGRGFVNLENERFSVCSSFNLVIVFGIRFFMYVLFMLRQMRLVQLKRL